MATSMPCWNVPVNVKWKFATSDPVIDSPVVIEDRVYATTELGGMFCLNAKTGKQIWWAPEVLHFVAAGKQRVYAADKLGRLRILDARNGATLDSLPTSAMPIKVSNGQTDRIYLATEGGIDPVSARGGTDQSDRLQREPQAAAGRRTAQDAAETEVQERTSGAPKVARRPRSPLPRRRLPRRTMPATLAPIPATSRPSPPKARPLPPAKAAAKAGQGQEGRRGTPADAGGDDPFGCAARQRPPVTRSCRSDGLEVDDIVTPCAVAQGGWNRL